MSLEDRIIEELSRDIEGMEAEIIERERKWEPDRRKAIESLIADARASLENIDPEGSLIGQILTAFTQLSSAMALAMGVMPSEFLAHAARTARQAKIISLASRMFGGDVWFKREEN